MNRVTLQGNLGKDPEVKYLENGTAVAKFSVATTERYKAADGEWKDMPTEWHNVIAWRSLAERAEKELKKGSTVHVEGKITYRKYTDKDGIERQTTDIVASSFHSVLTFKKGNDNGFPTEEPYSKPATKPAKPAAAETIPDAADDLPF